MTVKLRNVSESILCLCILALIWMLSFSIRLFAIIRYEIVVHEYDPYFNYRATTYLLQEGFQNFINWFDSRSWCPFGRAIGQTIYPGLMSTAAILHSTLRSVGLEFDIRITCVFLAPLFSGATACATFLLASEIADKSAGLLAAAFIGIAPSYISRSVAGSYDNEGVAVFAMVTTLYLLVKAVKTGSMMWSVGCCVMYFYMAASWGGYVFLVTMIPLYVMTMCILGRFSIRLYMAYCIWYVLGVLLSSQILVINFQAVQSMEHMPAMAVFFLLQLILGLGWVQELLLFSGAWVGMPHFVMSDGEDSETKNFGHFNCQPRETRAPNGESNGVGEEAGGAWVERMESEEKRVNVARWCAIAVGLIVCLLAWVKGVGARWSAGFEGVLLGQRQGAGMGGSAVAEEQAATWSAYFMQLHVLVPMAPVGLYHCFQALSDGKVLLVVYTLYAACLSAMMLRLLLLLTPALSLCAAMGISAVLKARIRDLAAPPPRTDSPLRGRLPGSVAGLTVCGVGWLLALYVQHAVWCSSRAYSAPSIVLSGRAPDGSRVTVDDVREGYRWMAHNVPQGTRVLAWWDYGYQMTALANTRLGLDQAGRGSSVSVLVDNNTRNRTHMALVGAALVSEETQAWHVMEHLGADYVVVLFGGLVGYPADDLNKLPSPLRLAAAELHGWAPPGGGRVEVMEEEGVRGEVYRVDGQVGSPGLVHHSVLYKLAYHRFAEMPPAPGKPPAWDRVRNHEAGGGWGAVEQLEEVFTSHHWLLRIFRRRSCLAHTLSPHCNRRPLGYTRAGLARRACVTAGGCYECGQSEESGGAHRGERCVAVQDPRIASACEPRPRVHAEALLPHPHCPPRTYPPALLPPSPPPASHRPARSSNPRRRAAGKGGSCWGKGARRGCVWCGAACPGAPLAGHRQSGSKTHKAGGGSGGAGGAGGRGKKGSGGKGFKHKM